jgi:AhpD family alkylhydroperoxidase
MTTQRLDTSGVAPELNDLVLQLEQYVRRHVDHTLLELVKLRASMLNGCAFCVDMHSADALRAGEQVNRLFGVAVWREAPFYTPAERAALALTDQLTRLGDDGVTDEVWDEAKRHFDDKQLVDLIGAIATINVWNRLSVAARKTPLSAAPTA